MQIIDGNHNGPLDLSENAEVLGTIDGALTIHAGDVLLTGYVTGDVTVLGGRLGIDGIVGGNVVNRAGFVEVHGRIGGLLYTDFDNFRSSANAHYRWETLPPAAPPISPAPAIPAPAFPTPVPTSDRVAPQHGAVPAASPALPSAPTSGRSRGRTVAAVALIALAGLVTAGAAWLGLEPEADDVSVLGKVEDVPVFPASAPPPTDAPPVESAPADSTPAPATAPETTTITTSTVPPTTTIDPALVDQEIRAAAQRLQELTVVDELLPETKYERDDYRTWNDEDGDCQSRRHEELIVESLEPPVLNADECKVESGLWIDAWAGHEMTLAEEATMDHTVPLSHAHQAGGWRWDDETKRAFANDPHPSALAVVRADTNSAKSDSAPQDWAPPLSSRWCTYAIDWISVKHRWELSVTPDEKSTLSSMLWTCGAEESAGPDQGNLQASVSAPDIGTTTTSTTTTSTTTTAAPPPPTTAAPEPPPRDCNPNYSGCVPNASDVDCAGGSGNGPAYVRGPVQVLGRDVYDLDRDGDGIGCE